ncbi:hypothetical protein ACRALDRAFT_208962 [Sodiomyces alcalophilus JCM 7366]|uniref:uncharacterized protein n=1 Tax=Sodiomyces alcalophilus JCM 7366 TaxID=591952 RepID=UPI0039B68A66
MESGSEREVPTLTASSKIIHDDIHDDIYARFAKYNCWEQACKDKGLYDALVSTPDGRCETCSDSDIFRGDKASEMTEDSAHCEHSAPIDRTYGRRIKTPPSTDESGREPRRENQDKMLLNRTMRLLAISGPAAGSAAICNDTPRRNYSRPSFAEKADETGSVGNGKCRFLFRPEKVNGSLPAALFLCWGPRRCRAELKGSPDRVGQAIVQRAEDDASKLHPSCVLCLAPIPPNLARMGATGIERPHTSTHPDRHGMQLQHSTATVAEAVQTNVDPISPHLDAAKNEKRRRP